MTRGFAFSIASSEQPCHATSLNWLHHMPGRHLSHKRTFLYRLLLTVHLAGIVFVSNAVASPGAFTLSAAAAFCRTSPTVEPGIDLSWGQSSGVLPPQPPTCEGCEGHPPCTHQPSGVTFSLQSRTAIARSWRVRCQNVC